jgi:glycerol-3-phosphate acyltransferase PlsY
MSEVPAQESIALVLAAAYFLGSIPFGLLLTRAAGLGDIRAIGSGNIGATNVLRTGRKGLAAATLFLDAAKAALAVFLAGYVAGSRAMPFAAGAAIWGHCFPVWLKFHGGKGVASGVGALLALDWRMGLGTIAVWAVVFAITRISSAGAIAACIAAPILGFFIMPPGWFLAPLLIGGFILWRHRENIVRLLAGTEPRFGHKKA